MSYGATIETNCSTVFSTVSANYSLKKLLDYTIYIVVASQVYLDCQIAVLQPAEAQPAVQPGPPHRLISATSSFSIFSPPSHRFLEPSPSRSLDRKTSPNPLTFAFLTSILIPTAAARFRTQCQFSLLCTQLSAHLSTVALPSLLPREPGQCFSAAKQLFWSKLSVLCFGPCF